jgi:hypothetical protein
MGTFGCPGILEATWCRKALGILGLIRPDFWSIGIHVDPWNPWLYQVERRKSTKKTEGQIFKDIQGLGIRVQLLRPIKKEDEHQSHQST